MLPDRFQWHDQDTRLKLGSYTLIIIDPETSPIALINIMRSCVPRRLFFVSHEVAIRYSETWCRKWEADIRLFVRNVESAAAASYRRSPDDAPISAPKWTSADESRRRRGGKRKVAVL